MGSEDEDMLLAWQQTFTMVVHEQNFKNGAFKHLITRNTPPLKSICIFLASDLLSGDDKQKFRHLAQSLVASARGSNSDSLLETLAFYAVTEKIGDIFREDMRERGRYMPPTMMQTLDRNNNIIETYEITNEGVKFTKGGQPGCYHSAPDEWNREHAERVKKDSLFTSIPDGKKDKPKAGAARMRAAKRKSTKNGKKGTAKEATENTNSTDIFGNASKENMRGAFM